VLAVASLAVVNGNLWAVAAVPIARLATGIAIRVPRLALFFYFYYPAHLAALAAIRCALH
jgi:hypothetical protein